MALQLAIPPSLLAPEGHGHDAVRLASLPEPVKPPPQIHGSKPWEPFAELSEFTASLTRGIQRPGCDITRPLAPRVGVVSQSWA